jgi:hypothetical protein
MQHWNEAAVDRSERSRFWSSLTDHFSIFSHILPKWSFPDRRDLENEKQGTRFGKDHVQHGTKEMSNPYS